MEIRVCNLKRYFGRTRAVDDVSFEFSSGHIFGFVGPNGAGKTTTLRILATLDEPTAGDALVDGVSVVQYPEKARQRVGFMPDSLPTHSDMTVYEYIDFFARAYGLRGRRRTGMVQSILDFTRLNELREKFLRALSKGMKQRVSLARAMVHDPPVLVLDEPAAGLDPRARVELRELLLVLADRGKAILISSHILTELSEICNGAVIIEKGKILRAGTLEQLVEQAPGQRTVLVRPLGDVQALHRELLLLPQVVSAQMLNGQVQVQVAGSEEDCCRILSALVGKGLSILEFRCQRADLEDVFMKVTTGGVQ